MLLAPLAAGAIEDVTVALGFLALAGCAWVVYRLGERWFGRAAGALAALLLITRVPILSYGVRAYVDIPYLLLVLGRCSSSRAAPARRRARARAARARRAAAPGGVGLLWPVLAVSAALTPRRVRTHTLLPYGDRQLAGLTLLAASAPLVWLLSDLAVTGDPLWSLTNTRHTARDARSRHRNRQRARVHPAAHRRDPAPAGARRARRSAACCRCCGCAGARSLGRGSRRARGARVRGLRHGRPADQHALRVPRLGDPVRVRRRRRVRLDAPGARRPRDGPGGWPPARCCSSR